MDYTENVLRIANWCAFTSRLLLLIVCAGCAAGDGKETVPSFHTPGHQYRGDFPRSAWGYWVMPVSWMDDYETGLPATDRASLEIPILKAFAAPGEYEPLNFMVLAQSPLYDVDVTVEPLQMGSETLGLPELRIVKRYYSRPWYNRTPDAAVNIARYLVPAGPVDISAGSFLQYWLTVQVPEDAQPGVYSGNILVAPSNQPAAEVTVYVEVLPVRLRPLEKKGYGLYYHAPADPALDAAGLHQMIRKQLADIRAHGADRIYLEHKSTFPVTVDRGTKGTYTVNPWGVWVTKEQDSLRVHFDEVRRNFRLLKELGFKGPYIVDSGLMRLARILSYDEPDQHYWQDFDSAVLATDAFRNTARDILLGLRAMCAEEQFPEVVLTYMDEVFGPDRLDKYIGLTRFVREITPEFRVYQTFHNRPDSGVREMINRIDPFVDIRCYHGHAIDMWLGAGHTFDELGAELKTAGDEAWCYYNPRSIDMTPEWMRLVNGLWLWLSPVAVHCPWAYSVFRGDPLYDADGYDYGFAFPVNGDIVPTRLWEAYREGVDDMQYLQTLEALIAERRNTAPVTALCNEASRWLQELKQQLLNVSLKREESALVRTWAGQYQQSDLDQWRRTCAEWIMKLQP